jgi:hypothetical protein
MIYAPLASKSIPEISMISAIKPKYPIVITKAEIDPHGLIAGVKT